jgi:nicotinamidase-related amidase
LKLAVIIVDMVEDFVTGKFGSTQAEALIPTLKDLLAEARSRGTPIIYLHDHHGKNDFELSVWGEHAMEGSSGSKIVSDLMPVETDIIIKKQVYSGFFNSELEEILKKMEVDTLIITGVSTDICVQHNVADAFFRGFKSYVVTDGTAAFDEDVHQSTLDYMKKTYGAEIVNSEQVKKLIT